MMNLVALGLLVTSMAIAGVWSPPPTTTTSLNQPYGGVSAAGREEQVIIKGGHRAVLVEYDGDTIDQGRGSSSSSSHGKTRVSISRPEEQLSSGAAAVFGVAQDAKEKFKHTVEVPGEESHLPGPRELICDAYGKCKHKISSALYRAKDKVAETAQEVEDEAQDTVAATFDKAKDIASKATHTGERVKDKGKDVGSKTGEKVEKRGEILKEKAKDVASKSGEKVEEGREVVKEKAKDVASKTSEKMEQGKEKAKQASYAVEEAGEKTKKEFSDIARRGREVVTDALTWLVSRESVDSVMSLAQLLGIGTAFGISVWVTFVMSHVLAGALTRQQLGVVQSRIYPVYFEAIAASIGLGLVGHLLGRRRKMVFNERAEMFQAINLLSSLGLVLVNLWYYEPRASKVMFERMKLEKEEGRGTSPQPSRLGNIFLADTAAPTTATTPAATGTTTTPTGGTPDTGQRRVTDTEVEVRSKMERLSERLKKLNSCSALLNVMTLMGLTWHLVYLSQRLLC